MRASGPLVRRLPDLAIRQVIRTLMIRGHDSQDRARESFDAHWPHYARNGAADALIRQVNALDVSDTLAVADRLPTPVFPPVLSGARPTSSRRSATASASHAT